MVLHLVIFRHNNRIPIFGNRAMSYLKKMRQMKNVRMMVREMNEYYLTDGIYPRWASFVKSITSPQTHKDRLFAKHQEAARKDVERAFGVLQARFAIIKKPSLAWDTDILHNIMLACIIIHNMIVEDERETYQNNVNTNEFMNAGGNANEDTTEYRTDRIVDIGLYLSRRTEIEDQQTHLQLKNDLVEHIWNKFGNNENLGN
ncbi:uncharacterized protein LOC110700768 [Chenopodium quinoa]|uniref:uncharacterized protein LOC110700768 n=1 Tax=Chenopodium quinoa TaxID=63459 RepID=UPI000B772ED0|nr:uncharacterized protein LOC110700768 [Chenopodium quinoa]